MTTLDEFRQHLKSRRLELGLKQKDMFDKTGLSRQQYQHIEKNGNPTLDTLLLIADGLNCELTLTPKESKNNMADTPSFDVFEDPWQGVLDYARP